MPAYDRDIFPELRAAQGAVIYGLTRDVAIATRIAKAAKACHLTVHNFDSAAPLIENALKKRPALILLDWDGCEAEAFKTLKEIRGNVDLKSVTCIGYVSGSKPLVREEAKRAGCLRVYLKTEWMQDLQGILTRSL